MIIVSCSYKKDEPLDLLNINNSNISNYANQKNIMVYNNCMNYNIIVDYFDKIDEPKYLN